MGDHERLLRALCVVPTLPHVTEAAWQAAKEREHELATHPCDDWRAVQCMCRGACSCHWQAAKKR